MSSQLPPLLQYNKKSPPTIYSCSGTPNEHANSCDGSCEQKEMTEREVNLHNAIIFALRDGINIVGIPASMQAVGIPGVLVEILELDLRVAAIIRFLTEIDARAEDRLNELYQEIKTAKLDAVRESKKQAERAQRTAIAVAKRDGSIFGPDGKSRLN